MSRKQDSAKGKITAEDLKRLWGEDRDLLKTIVEETLQQVLEAEMDEALQLDSAQRIQSLVVLSSPIASSGSARLAKFASRRRIPAISPFRAFAERGGLLSYGPNLRMFRRYSADYVDRILRGARPADLPIQQPTTFELVVNRRAAQALGLGIPDTLLLTAAQVLE